MRPPHPHHRLRWVVHPGGAGEAGKGRDLAVLAVTDHDTIAGVSEAQLVGDTLGLLVIRGVELSAKEHTNFYILGYGFRDGDTQLACLCEKFRAGRDERKYKIVDFLQEKGADIDLAELDALMGQLKDWGLDAIECYYPKYTPGQQAFYIRLAEKYCLHQTGGSDFHGEKVKPGVELARLMLDVDWVLNQ